MISCTILHTNQSGLLMDFYRIMRQFRHSEDGEKHAYGYVKVLKALLNRE
jgi:hypothetical protein